MVNMRPVPQSELDEQEKEDLREFLTGLEATVILMAAWGVPLFIFISLGMVVWALVFSFPFTPIVYLWIGLKLNWKHCIIIYDFFK